MTDPSNYAETNTEDDNGGPPDLGPKPGVPRWVKVFGIIAIVLIVIVLIGLLTGQLGPGGRHGPGRHMGGAGGPTSPSVGKQKPNAVGGPAEAEAAARTVEVTSLDTMTFEPSRIKVSAGETVTFVVTNTGQTVHEFTLGDATMQREHAEAMSHIPSGAAHGFPNSITLQPGETKRLTWRFGETGTLEYACHVQGHYEAGMRGQITIT